MYVLLNSALFIEHQQLPLNLLYKYGLWFREVVVLVTTECCRHRNIIYSTGVSAEQQVGVTLQNLLLLFTFPGTETQCPLSAIG